MGSIPGWGTKIPHASWGGQKKKKDRLKNNKDLNYSHKIFSVFQILVFDSINRYSTTSPVDT